MPYFVKAENLNAFHGPYFDEGDAKSIKEGVKDLYPLIEFSVVEMPSIPEDESLLVGYISPRLALVSLEALATQNISIDVPESKLNLLKAIIETTK